MNRLLTIQVQGLMVIADNGKYQLSAHSSQKSR